MTAKQIKEMALSIGACPLINDAESIADLIALMRTPQGREFCKKYKFPTLRVLREYKEELYSLGVYVDCGVVNLTNVEDVIVAGDTRAELVYDDTAKPYHVIVMNGADVVITAKGYAVCQVTRVGGNVRIEEKENANIFLR